MSHGGVTDISLPERFTLRLDLSRAATPRLLAKRPVHRWFWFPHSYSPELVEALLEKWGLAEGSWLLDPFVGAGTTLRVAQELGHAAVGTDLSPLSVLVSNVKVRPYGRADIVAALYVLQQDWQQRRKLAAAAPWVTSERLQRAFTPAELQALTHLRGGILALDEPVRNFFLVALLSILSEFSRAVADGGWFRWVERPERATEIAPRLWAQVNSMLDDLAADSQTPPKGTGEARLLDARRLEALSPLQFDGLITSPPYPNRHDYSRVFQLELLTLGESESHIFDLRHAALRSHVEARPELQALQPALAQYAPPDILNAYLERLPTTTDKRIPAMIKGYFEDMYLVLRVAQAVLKPSARTAWVVGNVRHAGVLFPVDEILAAIGESLGYVHTESWVLRLRGNSAQQMGKYGREPSRETVVMLKRSA